MKSLFNFYLDDNIKTKAIEKLNNSLGEENKGMLSAYLRVVISDFVKEPNISKELADKIKQEYSYSTKKNKRSKL